VLELGRTIAELSGRDPEIRHRPGRPGDIQESIGSPTTGRDALALQSPVALRVGLARVLEWLDQVG
jgi:hypothetical protein